MKIVFKRTTPSYRNSLSTKQIMFEFTIALLVIIICSLVYNFSLGVSYGIKVITMLLTSIVSSYICEALYFYLTKEKNIVKSLKNSFGYVTAILFALILPIGTPHYVIVLGSIFAILVGKMLFGGFGQNIFNPALVGRVFVMMSYASKLKSDLPTSGSDVLSKATPTTILASSNWITETLSLKDLYLGNYSASIGETFAFVILIIGVVLSIRKIIDWRLPLFYLSTTFLIALSVAISQGLPVINFPLAQIGIGGLAFGAIFMLTDPVTSPTSPLGKIIFAIGAGFFTMLFRYKSNMPEGVLYSILIMNMLTPMIDKYTSYPTNKNKTKQISFICLLMLLAIIIIIPISNISFGVSYPKFKNSRVEEVKKWCDSSIVKERNITCKFDENINDGSIIEKDPVKPNTILKRNVILNFEIKK